MNVALDEVVRDHASHLETVRPGLPASFNASNTPGDVIAQGDLMIGVVADWPAHHVKVTNPHTQLVPESGAGSHHRLASLNGVEVRYPPGWDVGTDTDSLDGPSLRVSVPTDIVHEPGTAHPHGTVTLVPGHTYHCTYQRTLVGETRREARARD